MKVTSSILAVGMIVTATVCESRAEDYTYITNSGTITITGFGSASPAVIANCRPVTSGFRLEWIPFFGWNSVVKCSTDLVHMPLTNLSTALPYPVNSYTDTVSNGKCFYRVDLEP